jgi:WD40 repeat protein
LQSTLFEEIEPAKKKGYTILHGIKSSISAIAVHPNPKISILAIAGSEGFILLWDYIKRGDPISNYEFFRKEDANIKNAEGKVFTAVEFTPDGLEILVA